MQRWRRDLLKYARWWRDPDIVSPSGFRTIEQSEFISSEDVVSGTDELAADRRACVLESLAWDGVDVRG